jgi:hypothetical protein
MKKTPGGGSRGFGSSTIEQGKCDRSSCDANTASTRSVTAGVRCPKIAAPGNQPDARPEPGSGRETWRGRLRFGAPQSAVPLAHCRLIGSAAAWGRQRSAVYAKHGVRNLPFSARNGTQYSGRGMHRRTSCETNCGCGENAALAPRGLVEPSGSGASSSRSSGRLSGSDCACEPKGSGDIGVAARFV